MLRLVIGTAALGLGDERPHPSSPRPGRPAPGGSKNSVLEEPRGAVPGRRRGLLRREHAGHGDEVVISEWWRHKTPPVFCLFSGGSAVRLFAAPLSPKIALDPVAPASLYCFLMPQRLRGRRVVGDCARRPFSVPPPFHRLFCIFSPTALSFLSHPPHPPTLPPPRSITRSN